MKRIGFSCIILPNIFTLLLGCNIAFCAPHEKKKEPIISNLKSINARVVVKLVNDNNNNLYVEASIKSDKNVDVGEVCYDWSIKPKNLNKGFGTIVLGDVSDPGANVKIESIGSRNSVWKGEDIINGYKENLELFQNVILDSIKPVSYYLFGVQTKDTVYEIGNGMNSFNCQFTLKAKCGFLDDKNQPNYPVNLFEGNLLKDFTIKNENGTLKILDERN